MTVPPRISLVTLGVADVERATAFYRALGWDLSSSSVPGEVSFFRLGGAALSLYGRDDLAADALVAPSSPPEFRGVSVAVNVASADEVDAALAAAAAAGATIPKPGRGAEWGGYSGYFADPDGHLWEVAHNPYWPLDEDSLPILP